MNLLRIYSITFGIIVFSTISMAQTSTKSVSVKTEIDSTTDDTLKFTVYGMDCPGCEGGLEKQVNKIPSVEYTKANWVDQELIVVMKQDSVLNEAELKKRVKKANFTLVTQPKNEEE